MIQVSDTVHCLGCHEDYKPSELPKGQLSHCFKQRLLITGDKPTPCSKSCGMGNYLCGKSWKDYLPEFVDAHWPKGHKDRGEATVAVTLFCLEYIDKTATCDGSCCEGVVCVCSNHRCGKRP